MVRQFFHRQGSRIQRTWQIVQRFVSSGRVGDAPAEPEVFPANENILGDEETIRYLGD